MTNKQQRTLILKKNLFKQLKRLNIQIVSWLIENQKVRGLTEQLSQHHSVRFTTRQCFYRSASAIRSKQEILKVADDMT